jgi:hypothetical protein
MKILPPIRSVGTPKMLDAKEYPCECVSDHRPALALNHAHHIVPLAWGGSDDPSNIRPLCPSGHTAVHRLLDRWRKLGKPGSVHHVNPYLYSVALEGWQRFQRAK